MGDRRARRKGLRGKIAGYAWAGGWIAALYAVAAPWRKLGGLESETLRWLEWVVLFGGLSLGFTVGRFARDAAECDPRRTHAGLLRVLLYPPAILTAGALVAWSFVGERGPIGVAFTAFLAYWAGLDLAFGALPLMEGKPYAFDRPLDAAEPPRASEEADRAKSLVRRAGDGHVAELRERHPAKPFGKGAP